MDENAKLCILIFFLGMHCVMGPQKADSYAHGRQDKDSDKGGCLIPEHPDNGLYVINNNTLTPGSYALAFSVLMVHCKKNYMPRPIYSKGISICIDGKWLNSPPLCARTCKSISSTETETVTCKYLGETLDNCDNPVEGTVARVECKPFHEPLDYSTGFIACHDGTWNFPVSSCRPVCGKKRPKGVPNVVGGKIVLQSDYPWHVAIYNAANDNICGGTIISYRIVLSAAHCFTDSYGKLYPINDYKIIAGKYYRAYDDSRDEGVQESPIDTIVLPERYKATVTNYEADLAILVLNKKLIPSVGVQPICVDWQNSFEKRQLIENNVGVVVGWGQTVFDSYPSTELKELQVPYKPFVSCFEQFPIQFRKFLTYDKICAGNLSKNETLCQVDGGSGLAFQKDGNRFYLRGIASTSPATKETGTTTCDPNQYATYTLISSYISLIADIEIQNRS